MKRVALLLAGWGLAWSATPMVAEAAEERERALRAALVVKLASLAGGVSAEEHAEPTLEVCIVGRHDFGSALSALEGSIVDGRRVEIRYFASPRELDYCPTLFVPSSEAPRARQILDALAGTGAMSVSDIEGFARSGGVIELVSRLNRVGFFVNVKAATANGVALDESVIRLASRVYR